MKLVFVGGIKGVGKTTLILWLKKKLKRKIVVLDCGDLFRRHVYQKKSRVTKTADEVEGLIARKIENMPRGATVVLHWHYAVRHRSGYIPQVSFRRLKCIAKDSRIEKVVLLLVVAPVAEVYKRRLKEIDKKKRALSRKTIKEEMAMDEKFMAREKKIFERALGCKRVVVLRIVNDDLRKAQPALYSIFKDLLQ